MATERTNQGSEIEAISEHRCLRIVLEDCLSFQPHIWFLLEKQVLLFRWGLKETCCCHLNVCAEINYSHYTHCGSLCVLLVGWPASSTVGAFLFTRLFSRLLPSKCRRIKCNWSWLLAEFSEGKLLFQTVAWTQKWDGLTPGPVHGTAPITHRSIWWQPTRVSINQPAAVLSNSLPTHTHTHCAFRCNCWPSRLAVGPQGEPFRLTGTESKRTHTHTHRGSGPRSNNRRWSQCVTPQKQLWPFLRAISLRTRQTEGESR